MIMLLFCTVNVSANVYEPPDEVITISGVTYNVNYGSSGTMSQAIVASIGTAAGKNVVIPETIKVKNGTLTASVYQLGEYCCQNDLIETLTIKSDYPVVDDTSIYDCPNLKTVTFAGSASWFGARFCPKLSKVNIGRSNPQGIHGYLYKDGESVILYDEYAALNYVKLSAVHIYYPEGA